MAFTLSAGVSVQEVDLTTVVPAVSSTAGAFAGFFRWGPVNQPNLFTSETQMASMLQPPNSNTAVFYWTAANFLSYGNNLNIVRANSVGLQTATSNGAPTVMIPNKESYFNNNFNGNGGVYGPWAARYPGDLGNSLVVSVCPSSNAFASNLTSQLNITANATTTSSNVTLSSNATANLIIGDLVSVGIGSGISIGSASVVGINGTTITLSKVPVTANGTGLTIQRQWQFAQYFSGAPKTSPFATTKSSRNDQMHIAVVDANAVFFGSSSSNYVLETYPFVSKASDAKNNDSSTNYYKSIIYNKSAYIHWLDHIATGTNWGIAAQGINFTTPSLPTTTPLSGGADITTPYNPQGFTGGIGGINDTNDAGLIQAFSYFQSSDSIDISLIPTGPASVTVQQYIIDNIVTSRLDCVSFHSPRFNDVVDNIGFEATTIVNSYLADLGRSSSYAVVDSGWKYQFDKYNNIYLYVPLNADIAGLCVRTDAVANPWWSPAGYNRGTIKNVVRLAWNPSNLTNSSTGSQSGFRDFLYQNGVNPVVTFKGQGTILYGDKTLQSQPSAFDRINVRRLFIVLEKSISIAAKYSLFEFNDNFTRSAFINLVTPFLTTVKGGRGIQAFQVVCDATNNTPDVIDHDQFVGDIYIKPARSINFINLRFVAVGTGVTFEEIVGTV